MEMFIIAPPLNPWDKPADEIAIRMGASAAATAGEAWRRHTRGDMSKVQFWFDRGYRVRQVDVTFKSEHVA